MGADWVDDKSTLLTYNVIFDFGKISQRFNNMTDNDGRLNTWELYNFEGLNDASSMMQMFEEWGIYPDRELPLNTTDFAARACALKNKFNKEVNVESGQTVERALLREENLVWYLPARYEAQSMKDVKYPLNGDYWTSTAVNDNQHAFKYTVGNTTTEEIRTANLHVRAVRQKP